MALDKLKEIIAQELGVSVDEITPESNLQEDLGADSLDAVELIMAVEEEFGVSIPDEEAQNINTVQDMLNLLNK